MTDSKRTDVVQALKTRLALILTASGYETNLGSNIFEWRDPKLELTDLPAMVIRDVSESVEEGITSVESFLRTLTFEGEITAVETSTIPAVMRQCLTDFEKAIAVDEQFGGLAEGTYPVESTIETTQGEKIISKATITFSINYRTDRWDAYP